MGGDELRGTAIKTHIYLRTAMVCLLVALGVSVWYQTRAQDYHLLSSVSAYYYTPAQTIFVGSLIGFGACLIALRGATDAEDLFLNLAGVFAIIVAAVPTSRGPDYRTAERVCAITPPPDTVDCKTYVALRDAAQSNIDTSMTALIGVAAIGLLATILLVLVQRRKDPRTVSWPAFAAGLIVLVAIVVAYFAAPGWYTKEAHYVAAGGLILCIAVVAFLNRRRNVGYAWPAVAILVEAVAGIILMFTTGLSLFWVEVVVGALFIVYWAAQTYDQLRRYQQTPADLASLDAAIAQAESAGDAKFFDQLLAAQFAMRRANGRIVSRTEFISEVAPSPARNSTIQSVEEVGDRAVVQSLVTTGGREFHNIRVFVRASPNRPWSLLAWANEPVGQSRGARPMPVSR